MPSNNQNDAPTDGDGLSFFLFGDVVAVGEDTLTVIDSDSWIYGNEGKAMGIMVVGAKAESPYEWGAFANAEADVIVADAGQVKIKEETVVGENGAFTVVKFEALDDGGQDGKTEFVKEQKITYSDEFFAHDVEGNVAVAEVESHAFGDNTLVDVDVFALTVEDEASLSTAVVIGAVA